MTRKFATGDLRLFTGDLCRVAPVRSDPTKGPGVFGVETGDLGVEVGDSRLFEGDLKGTPGVAKGT